MAARKPSIKGSVFSRVVEDVNKAIADGRVSRADLSRWLEPGDCDLLEERVALSSWYDIRSYDRMNALLLEVEGEGDLDYFRQQGLATAKFLLKRGFYSQLEYLHRTEVSRQQDPQRRFEAFGRDIRLVASLSAGILNFSVWTSKPDPDHPLRHLIEVSEAEDVSEALAHRSEGFINGMATSHGTGRLWDYTRPRPDLVVYRMRRDA
ncbi:MAG TPA: hypothetical protein VNI57_02650 [Candidatus Saccharimonadales bacterium]|nr:hypothetical protein [Candidatus Saccharimonadales bacterium]